MTKTAIIAISDLHINSTVAICTPTVNKDDGQTEHASRTQMWLWRSWLDFIRQVEIDTQGMRRVLVVNGDLGELDTQKRSIQLMTLNKATILRMVVDVLEPALSIADKALIMRGTSAHTGKSSWLEEATAKDLDGVMPQAEDIFSHWHYRGVCEGVRLDIAHHVNAGGLPWNKGNAANKLAARTLWQYKVQRDALAPHLVVRSHNHQYSSSGDNFETTAVLTPAWTVLTEYGYRIGLENVISDIGGVVIFCDDGKWEIKKYLFQPKEAKQVWKMTL